jgi:hypothetical protein
VEDCARPARRLVVAILFQTIVDLRSSDALVARQAMAWVRHRDPRFVLYCHLANVDPDRLRRVLLRAFFCRVERIDAAHRASLKKRGRPRKVSTKGTDDERNPRP